MANLQTRTLSFLFTELEEQAKLRKQYSELISGMLARHDVILRSTIVAHAGQVFRTTRGAFFAVFHTPNRALSASVACQRALISEQWDPEMGLPNVRMAIHTGMVESRNKEYFGQPISDTSALLSAAHGGQILISETAYGLVYDNLPAGIALRDLGVYHLKDLSQPVHVFQVSAPDLRSEFPPLRTLDNRLHNLPLQQHSLVGRENELASAEGVLLRTPARVVTLMGTESIDKTRLALQIAAGVVDEFEHGVFYINLATVDNSDLAAAAIAQTLGIEEYEDQATLDALKDYLREKELLLVLDRFERVMEFAPTLAELLAVAPRLKALVTSIGRLGIGGEFRLAVLPL